MGFLETYIYWFFRFSFMNRKKFFKDKPLVRGFSFGLTSGVITTLGMIVGLDSALHSKTAIIAGILSIAIADSMSDAFGMHIAEEAGATKIAGIWRATLYTLLYKFLFTIIFLVPIIFMELTFAVNFSIVFGISLIAIYSYFVANKLRNNPWKAVGEHVAISILVVIATRFVGNLVNLIL